MTKSLQPSRNTSSANKLDIIRELNLRAVSAEADIEEILRKYQVSEPLPELKELVGLTQYLAEAIVIKIFQRFHLIAVTLLDRYAGRETLKINDEYDVQDLLEALLRIYFDDVRPEEPTESYGGSPSFIDFLLKRQRIGIEVKHGNRGRRKIKEEINSDKYNYKIHTNCTKLLCLVYDPSHKIKNAPGFEADLSDDTSGLETQVFVVPKP